MSTAADHDRFREDVAAYLLGALGEGEDTAFERHLSECHVCQDELGRLRVAAQALPRSVAQFQAPPSLKQALMAEVRRDAAPEPAPRRSLASRLGLDRLRLGGLSPQLGLATAVVLLAVGVLAGFGVSKLGGGDGNGDSARSLAASVDTTRVGDGHATVVLPRDGGGGQLRVSSLPQPPHGQVYEIWLVRGGQVEPGPLFSVDRNGNGVGAIPADLQGVTRVMVTRERAGGARQPTEAPVLSSKV
jgi:hypothetical protein